MLSENEVRLVGHLGSDPEIQTVGEGTKLTKLRLATSRVDRNRTEYTDWHNVTAWGDQIAAFAGTYLKKGSHVAVKGRLQTRTYTTGTGEERTATEVVAWRVDAVGKLDYDERTTADHAPAPNGPTSEGFTTAPTTGVSDGVVPTTEIAGEVFEPVPAGAGEQKLPF